MLVILVCYFSKMLWFSAKSIHVLSSSISKHLCCNRGGIDSSDVCHILNMFVHGICSVHELENNKMNSACSSLQRHVFIISKEIVISMITLEVSEPLSIFSKPKARTQSAFPDSIICLANMSADEPVEQLLFTLKIGIPVIPTS